MSLAELGISLPAENVWQVYWYGALTPMPTGRSGWGIHTYFRQIAGVDPSMASQVIRLEVSLAHMHLLPIGRCVAGTTSSLLGIQPLTDRTERATYLVDLSAENTYFVARSDLRRGRVGGAHQDDPRYDGMLIRVGATANTPEVIIPCASLFQYFWGASSRIAKLVTSGRIALVNRYICSEEQSGMDDQGLFTLRLRQGMANDDARYLATLLAEPYALEMGCQVAPTLARYEENRSIGKVTRLEVAPPFARPLRLTGFFNSGWSDSGAPILYLTHIVSSDLVPAWKSLEYSRENDSGKGLTDDGSEKLVIDRPTFPKSGIPADYEEIDVEEVAAQGGREKTDLPLLPNYMDRFPDMASLPASELDKETARYQRPEKAPYVKTTVGPYSAIEGIATTGESMVSAELTGSDSDVFGSNTEAETLASIQPAVHELLADFAEFFAKLPATCVIAGRQLDVSVTFVDPYVPSRQASNCIYFSVPRRVNEEVLAWLYKDPDLKLRKFGMCAKLDISVDGARAETRYVLDFEPRHPRRKVGSESTHETRNGFLVVWFDGVDQGVAAADHLRRTIASVALKGNPKLHKRPAQGVASCSFRHYDYDHQGLLRKILDASDQCAPV